MNIEQKIIAYCDLNEIAPASVRIRFAEIAQSFSAITNIYAWNTLDFLAIGIWKLLNKTISDEEFFQIGDITSSIPLKQPRPFLDACKLLQEKIDTNTLYVIDEAAKIAFVHQYWQSAFDALLIDIEKKKSKLYIIETTE